MVSVSPIYEKDGDAPYREFSQRAFFTQRLGKSGLWRGEAAVLLNPARRTFALPASRPFRHDGEVYSARFSPDGKRVATAGIDKKVRIWNAQSGDQVGQPLRHEGLVWDVQFSLDGAWLTTISHDRTLRIWRTATSERHWQAVNQAGNVKSVSFSPDSRFLVSCTGRGQARLWNVETAEEILQNWGEPKHAQCAEFPDPKRMAIGFQSAEVRIFDVETGQSVAPFLPLAGAGRFLEFSRDGKQLVCADENGFCVWNPYDWEGIISIRQD